MPVSTHEVRTFVDRLMCDCGGEMKPTGECMLSMPAIYPHRCEACGKGESVRGFTYPRVRYGQVSAEVS